MRKIIYSLNELFSIISFYITSHFYRTPFPNHFNFLILNPFFNKKQETTNFYTTAFFPPITTSPLFTTSFVLQTFSLFFPKHSFYSFLISYFQKLPLWTTSSPPLKHPPLPFPQPLFNTHSNTFFPHHTNPAKLSRVFRMCEAEVVARSKRPCPPDQVCARHVCPWN